MSIYDKASLVLIPSGTKTSKVYSQKPVNGDGDFTFSRSTAATRVNADGNIEKETQNLLLQSNTFDSGVWSNDDTTETGGQSGYDGTSNAWKVVGNTNASRHYIVQSISKSGVNTWSLYAKASGHSYVQFGSGSTTNQYVNFDLSDGSIGNIGSDFFSAIAEDIGGGWYRLSVVDKISTNGFYISLVSSKTAGWLESWSMSNATDGIYIQDAQLEQGLVARDYIETTTAAVEGGITDNVPRLDYTDSSCPALLLEPQRTNKLSNSEYINSGSTWVEDNGADCTPNYSTSPEGVDNATRVQLDNSGAFSLTRIYHDFVPNASNDTASFYAKSNTGSSFGIVIYLRDSGFGAVRGFKTITITNEWQRFDLTADCSGASGNVMFLIYNTTANENWDFLMYGAQVEAGSYATSYIPTYGTSVTRNEDACTKTGISSLIGQSEGTLFVEVAAIASESSNKRISISDGTNNNRVTLSFTNASITAFVVSGGIVSVANSLGISTPEEKHKIAVAYKENDFVVYVDGMQVLADTSGDVPVSMSEFKFSDGSGLLFFGNVDQSLLFKTRLSNEELAALTTI